MHTNPTRKQIVGDWLSGAGLMFWQLDREFKVVNANGLFIKVFGDPVGERCHTFMTGKDHVCPDCPVKQVFLGAERSVSEHVGADTQGREVTLSHTAMPVKNAAGEILGATELIADTTHRKRTHNWLRDSERRYRTLIEQMPDVLFILDQEGKLIYVNTEVEKFLGYPVREILETPLKQHVVPEDRPRLDTIVRLGPRAIWDEEVAMTDRLGEKKFARIRCKALILEDRSVRRFEGVMRDITRRRTLEEELRASRTELLAKIKIIDELYEHIVQSERSKVIEEHTAEMAHELRQPLAIIGGFVRRMIRKLASEEAADPGTQMECFQVIIREIERLEKILDSLIDFSKRERIELEYANPNHLVQYVVKVHEERIAERGLSLEVHLGRGIGDILLDPGRFQQVVRNLVANAIEASPPGGVIRVETGVSIPSDRAHLTGKLESEGYFEMKIRNGGRTIPPEDLQQVFNPFFTTKQFGTGIGLTICRKIVERHKGSISVKSDARGTVFTVWLPADQTIPPLRSLSHSDTGRAS